MSDTYFYPVTGRKNTGGVFDRIPIEELQTSQPYQFTLFVLGYSAVQGVTPTFSQAGILFPGIQVPATSYIEIAGIHGRPYTEYAGDRKSVADRASDFNPKDKKDTLPVPSRFGGYCNHGSVSFPTWHRPYVMLVEQAIGDFAVQFAEAIEQLNPEEKGIWTTAAKQVRFPYWDWADPKVETEGLPPVLYEETIPVRIAGGKTATVQNPFSFYTFQGPIPADFEDVENPRTGQIAYFSAWKRTYRYAASSPNPPGSDITALQASLKQQASDIRTKIGLLFTFDDDEDPPIIYDEFSNQVNESRRQMDYRNQGSLESVHGTIHGVLGGNGHMSNPDYAGFDPIFFCTSAPSERGAENLTVFLQSTTAMWTDSVGKRGNYCLCILNVLLVALWEWCYPDYWMGNGYTHDGVAYPWTQQRGTYAQVYNEQILPTGARGLLPPFRNEDGTYWTSEQTRFLDPKSYPKYYSYKEFLGVKVDQPATDLKQRQDARARIAKYYTFNPQSASKSINSAAWSHLSASQSDVFGLPANLKSIDGFRVFIVLVRLPEHAFNRSYSFQLFFNGTGNEHELIGSVTVFARSDHSPCQACAVRRDNGTVVRGVIPLRSSFVNQIIVNSGIDRTKATLDTTSASITKSLSGKLVDTAGKLLATAKGGDDVDIVPIGSSTAPKVTPVEISLLSSAVAEHVDDENHPVKLFDWKPHNDLFPSGWRAVATEAK
ncbi:common central domain of tyrosinase-domain-containing protein [Phlebopus sp. FC_14]|nr:common central domain of tyrosinase-domain-containing protein [Phlebopus sp. FC_14]